LAQAVSNLDEVRASSLSVSSIFAEVLGLLNSTRIQTRPRYFRWPSIIKDTWNELSRSMSEISWACPPPVVQQRRHNAGGAQPISSTAPAPPPAGAECRARRTAAHLLLPQALIKRLLISFGSPSQQVRLWQCAAGVSGAGFLALN
jgi:hypothetical protein